MLPIVETEEPQADRAAAQRVAVDDVGGGTDVGARQRTCRAPLTVAQTGFAPAVPHLANLPFALLQRTAAFLTVEHFTNLLFPSRQGAPIAGLERTARAMPAEMILRIKPTSFELP